MRRRPWALGSVATFSLLLALPVGAGSIDIPFPLTQILRVEADGSQLEQVLQADLALGYRAIDADPVNGRIYWAGFGEPAPDPIGFTGLIRRANVDGSDIQVVVGGEGGVKVDPAGGKVYYVIGSDCDPCTSIFRANLNGSNVQQLAGGVSFTPLGLDPVGGKLYWYDQGSIVEANLDGSGAQDLIVGVVAVSSMAVDSSGQKLYWITYSNTLSRANLDGTQIEDLVTVADGGGLALDPEGDRMWWTEPDAGTIRRAHLDGSGVTTIRSGLIDPRGITYLASGGADGQLYFLGNPQNVSIPVPATGAWGSALLLLLLAGTSGLLLRRRRYDG